MNRKPVINDALVADRLLFATALDRCRYLGTSSSYKARWLKEHAGRFLRIDDIAQESAQLGPPVENKNNVEAVPAVLTCETSSRDVRKDGDDDNDLALVDSGPGDYSPPYLPTSLTTPVKANIPNGSTRTELLPRAKAAMSETTGPETEATPLGEMGRKGDRSGGRQLKKQKLPVGTSKIDRKLSPERMRTVLDSLRECPILYRAADKAGIHRKTLKYWMERSAAGHDGYDIEWQDGTWRFHEHCESAIAEAHDRVVVAVWDIAMGRVIYRTDQHLVDLGYQGADAYAKDENGNFIVETVRQPNTKMLQFLLELLCPGKWGKRRKIDVSHKGHVLVVGNATKQREYNTAASVKARTWKAYSRRIRNAKA